ncbi:hypothetical protein BJ138DRAFT_164644 [Hygrophoropsis aurantiaca]|uniref:Uncharacterized protein n=1 Tax=Hygrophoropsis aurantiaca TaxID=72124 RepID=A0ACB8A9G3_9AGAM|nr:hypothetical protein BJ138DRAFT_164644 [Hygrophoropsis aurantiaca]
MMFFFQGINLLTASSASALAFLVWECCTTLADEVEYIWSKPNVLLIKWLYLLTRYVGLLSLLLTPFFGYGSSLSCLAWIAIQMGEVQAMITLVEIVLMMRVHALYNRDPRMLAFLIFLILVATVGPMTGMALIAPKMQFSPTCAVLSIETSLTFISYIFSVTESILLLLTIAKCIHTFRKTTREIPVITLMLRDGTLAFFALVAMVLPMSIVLTVVDGAFISVLHPWFIAVYSCAGCRVVLNMQRLAIESGEIIAGGVTRAIPTTTMPMITSQINIEPLSQSAD